MALSLEITNVVKQRVLAETRKPAIQAQLKTLFSYLAQHKGSPGLQITFFSALAGTDVVAADAACKVYGWYIKKPTASVTAAYLKASNHASALDEASPEVELLLATNQEVFIPFLDGLPMSTGFTIGSNTDSSGSTGSSAADRPDGFVIVGAP